MKCKKYREQIILRHYGELSKIESNKLEEHLKLCPECAEELKSTYEVFSLMDKAEVEDIPQADWNKCWGGINTQIQKPQHKSEPFSLFPRWAPVAAVAVFVFALGIFLGRFWQTEKTILDSPPPHSLNYLDKSLQEHFDNLKPLLIEYANYSPGVTNGDQIVMDRKMVQGLLIQNFLLMKTLAKNNPGSALLLEDIELVLREITNLESGDNFTQSLIKELIDQRDILFKMEILQKI